VSVYRFLIYMRIHLPTILFLSYRMSVNDYHMMNHRDTHVDGQIRVTASVSEESDVDVEESPQQCPEIAAVIAIDVAAERKSRNLAITTAASRPTTSQRKFNFFFHISLLNMYVYSSFFTFEF